MQRRHATSNHPGSGFPNPSNQSITFNRRSNPGNALSSITTPSSNQDRDRCIVFLGAIVIMSIMFFSYEVYMDTEPSALHMSIYPETDLNERHISHTISDETLDATDAMLKQPSHWVDGEKKLKKRLGKLEHRQQEGIDVGVDHLTRWMGKDIPVWNPKDGSPVEFDDDDNASIDILVKNEEAVIQEQAAKEKPTQNPQELIRLPSFPTPTDVIGDNASIRLQPSYGKHRPEVDAVFGLAEGYDLTTYVAFLETLKETGFTGDVVLSVSSSENMKRGVEDYLKKQDNLVIYMMEWSCYNQKGESKATAGEGANLCQANGIYQTETSGSGVDDPRVPRPVATSRYELYWMWASHYDDLSMIMLIDSRDTFFQSNPFDQIERSKSNIRQTGGLLHFFGENRDAVSLQTSKYNLRWLQEAYGSDLNGHKSMLEKQVICSGSTMGEKFALDMYLRAVIAEFDSTKCILKGCDQGFHNYLYYSKALEGVPEIKQIILHDQGKGVINNLGALREKSLKEQKVLDNDNHVLNWDGSISPVAHQFDRDDDLRKYMNTKKKEMVAKLGK